MPYCERCHNEGMYLEEDTAKFCSCSAGQERKKAWDNYNRGQKFSIAEDDRKEPDRIKEKKDYKEAAAGDKEEDDVPF